MRYTSYLNGFYYRTRWHVACVFLVLVFLCLAGEITVSGQVFPFSPYLQAYWQAFSIPGINNVTLPTPYFIFNPLSRVAPYLGLYNPYSFANSYTPFSSASLFPQASLAGSLFPFAQLISNPLLLPYSAAALYYAAVTPDVTGAWTGVWTSTFLAGGITTGDLSMTLIQNGSDVTGTVAFFLNKILKFGADVVGTIVGNTLTLTSTVIPGAGGTKSFDVTIEATVTDVSMEGTYIAINNVTGKTAEQGTFTATKI